MLITVHYHLPPVTAKGTGPESTAWLLLLKGTPGGDVSANKRTGECNDAKPIISAYTGYRATFWVRNIDTDPPLAELIIRDYPLYNCNFVRIYQCVK